MEQSPWLRADYIRCISRYSSNQLVFADEMSKNDLTYARLTGRAPRGARAVEDNEFVRQKRSSLLAGMALDQGIFAARVVLGSFNSEKVREWLEEDLPPVMNPYPGPCSVLVLDNAKIYHFPGIEKILLSKGCLIKYLSPHSPDYDPIEQAFSAIKSWLRDRGIAESLDNARYHELYQACQIITPEMTWGFLRHSMYYV